MADSSPTYGVLGALQLRHGDVVVPLPSPRQRAVLAALVARRGRVVEPDALIEAAWPERLPVYPLAALHTIVSRLRHVLGSGSVRSDPRGYLLDAEPGAVDAGRFEALLAEAAVAQSALYRADLLDEALRMWRGRAYEEFSDRSFAQAEAVRLDELRLGAVEDRADLALQLGEPVRAAADLEAMLVAHPLRERARSLLMTALYDQGRHVAALESFRSYQQQLADDLGLDPSPALRAVEAGILNHEMPHLVRATPSRGRAASSWAMPADAFVGRDDESTQLLDAVAEHPLVTITGVGGVGKTRLAAQVLPWLSRRLGLQATVVELGAVEPADVDTAVAAAFGLGATGERARGDIVEYLSIVSGLLVLDNCEHALDEVGRLAAAVLQAAPAMRLLATSRHRIGLPAEQLLPLQPLAVPDPDSPAERAELSAAMRLFADRVRRLRPAFAMDADQVLIAAEICRRLDGVPLLLELAASRAATLGLRPVLDHLARPLELLAGTTARGSRNLREVIAWSYRLLDENERRLLAALSVFVGDFDLAAIELMADAIGVGSAPTVAANLVEASLIVVNDDAGPPRHRLLAMVRAFAAERLAASPDDPAAHLGHARWVHSIASHAAQQALHADDPGALWSLEFHRADLAAGVQWSLASDDGELAARIACAVCLCSHWRPGASLLSKIGAIATDHRVLRGPAAASALAAGAAAALDQGNFAGAEEFALAALERPTTTEERSLALLTLAVAALYRGQHEQCSGWLNELLAVPAVPIGLRMDARATAALIACYSGDLPTARDFVDRASVTAEVAGQSGYRAFVTYAAGEFALAAGDPRAIHMLRTAVEQAEECAASQVAEVARIALVSAHVRLGHRRDSIEVLPALIDDLRRMSNWTQLWTSLRILAELLAESGEEHTAALLLGAANSAAGAPALTGADVARYNDLQTELAARLGPTPAAQIRELAAGLPRAQIVDHALSALARLRRDRAHPGTDARSAARAGGRAGRRPGRQVRPGSLGREASW